MGRRGHSGSVALKFHWKRKTAPVAPAGRYTPIYQIATGGMSEIWASLDRETGRMVAVKRLMPHAMEEIRAEKSGLLEEHALRRVRHPNILEFIEKTVQDGRWCFVTEYIPGVNFDHYLSKRALGLARFAELVPQLLEGVSAIHGQGLVHGDLKPENMMLMQEPDGRLRVKILDFGTADLMEQSLSVQQQREPHTILATAEYVAPELLQGWPPSVASDLYALGMSFYHILAGRPAFDYGETEKTLQAQVDEVPKPVCEIRPEVPQSWSEWVMRFLEKEVVNRPQSAQEAWELWCGIEPEACLLEPQEALDLALPQP
jgi:eukaryotic-like serine/threonine-protein kinase